MPISTGITNPDGPADREIVLGKARELSTFAGIWVDPFRSELHVAVSGDIDSAVATLKPLVPKGQTLYVHQFQRTYAALHSIQDAVGTAFTALRADGIWLSYVEVDEKRNCVVMGIDPVTPQVVSNLRSKYGDPIDFEFSARPFALASPWPTEPEIVQAVESAPQSEQLVTCGGHLFPASVLASPDVDDVPSDLASVVDAAVKFWSQDAAIPAGLHWRLAYRDDASAEFVAKTSDGWADLTLSYDAKGWSPAGFGDCTPAGAGIDGVGRASWVFDTGYPAPVAESTQLHVLITEMACASGQPAFGRIAPAVVVYSDTSLSLTVGVRSAGGVETCPSNPSTPATIILPRALGDRSVVNGDAYSQATPESTSP